MVIKRTMNHFPLPTAASISVTIWANGSGWKPWPAPGPNTIRARAEHRVPGAPVLAGGHPVVIPAQHVFELAFVADVVNCLAGPRVALGRALLALLVGVRIRVGVNVDQFIRPEIDRVRGERPAA